MLSISKHLLGIAKHPYERIEQGKTAIIDEIVEPKKKELRMKYEGQEICAQYRKTTAAERGRLALLSVSARCCRHDTAIRCKLSIADTGSTFVRNEQIFVR